VVAHTRPDLDAAVAQIRNAFVQHEVRDGLVAIERTGRYRRVVQRAFGAVGSSRASSILLSPSSTASRWTPATRPPPPTWLPSTALPSPAARFWKPAATSLGPRCNWSSATVRDLVCKGAALNCQIRDHLETALLGYAACVDKLSESRIS